MCFFRSLVLSACLPAVDLGFGLDFHPINEDKTIKHKCRSLTIFVIADMLAVLSALVALSLADTPANCTYESIVGTWIFNIGPGGNGRTLNCSEPFEPVSQYTLTLSFPDNVVDTYGNVGFFTLIYNQGFEVVINQMKYFAFSYYEEEGDVVTSYCSSLFPGWSHAVDGTNWACYAGVKVSADSSSSSSSSEGEISRKTVVDMDQVYSNQKEYVAEINKIAKSWTAKEYSDYETMTINQLRRRAGATKGNPFPADINGTPKVTGDTPLPSAFDWSDVNGIDYVSPIRDQGNCGSCYAFGSSATYEARVRIQTNLTLQPIISPQDIVSCSNYSQGCEGGFPYLMGKYASDFGFVEETCNPYVGTDTPTCTTNQACSRWYVDTTSYHYIGGFYGACTPSLMMAELYQNGPIAVSFEVYNDFLQYTGGVYVHTEESETFNFNPWQITNHVVSIVGWGWDPTSQLPYWRVKNSWGTSWGEDGFFRILRGADECNIESIAVAFTPLLSGH